MNITAYVNIINQHKSIDAQKLRIQLTISKASDFDDVIDEIEATIFEDYGVNLYYGTDFTIDNEEDICDEISEN